VLVSLLHSFQFTSSHCCSLCFSVSHFLPFPSFPPLHPHLFPRWSLNLTTCVLNQALSIWLLHYELSVRVLCRSLWAKVLFSLPFLGVCLSCEPCLMVSIIFLGIFHERVIYHRQPSRKITKGLSRLFLFLTLLECIFVLHQGDGRPSHLQSSTHLRLIPKDFSHADRAPNVLQVPFVAREPRSHGCILYPSFSRSATA